MLVAGICGVLDSDKAKSLGALPCLGWPVCQRKCADGRQPSHVGSLNATVVGVTRRVVVQVLLLRDGFAHCKHAVTMILARPAQ